jgi:UDP-N-acetylmuramate--alanine ligase
VALELQIDAEKVREALKGFGGISRRLEFKGAAGGIKVFDDYGHHPTEIRATLKALRESLNSGRLFVVFQPHRYTRTRDLFAEFTVSFDNADDLVMMDIYPAGEPPINGITTEALVNAMKKVGVSHIKGKEEVARFVASRVSAGDVVLTLGAGDVWEVGEKILRGLEERN